MIPLPTHCTPCSRYTLTVFHEEATTLIAQVPDWVVDDDSALTRSFSFPSFAHACQFVSDLAPICDEQDHHPNVVLNGFGKPDAVTVEVTFSTYFRGPRLTLNDFVMASLVDKLFDGHL